MTVLLLFVALAARAQQPDSAAAPVRNVQLANVDVAPSAADTKGWLLLDRDIALELEGAVQNLYNLKHDKAEKQFRSLRRRYPAHPMPYFLMGLSQWWKMVPSQLSTKAYDAPFLAYMDTAITKAETLYEADDKNYEACFFLSAAYGFAARLHAERSNWRKATVYSKHALDYLAKSQEANGLSPEFLFGQGLMNYYAVWLGEQYPLLRPVLWLFPKGNRQLGLQQLNTVAQQANYTAPETQYFLLRIYYYDEHRPQDALPLARTLATKYPDNAYFQRFYAMACFNQGALRECEKTSRDILDKLNQGLPGYEAISGRYAAYYLGYLTQHKYKDLAKAKEYYQRCIVFAESTGDTKAGYFLHANWNLAKLAEQEQNWSAATRYFTLVRERAEPASEMAAEANAYFKQRNGVRKAGKRPAAATLSLAK
ncbi:tol-pal system protein YbgF [Hymenobacter sp. CRA2]|nr:tol-pal system protein YbgF [Hymenobacter sp. CRA2]